MKRLSRWINRLLAPFQGCSSWSWSGRPSSWLSLAPFSGPLRFLGLAGLLGLDFGDVHRVGRIIMLYHSLAIPFVAALVYLVLDQLPIASAEDTPARRRSIVVPITVGYMLTSIGGMTFAYGGRNWIAHGSTCVGLSLVFYAGVLLAIALWPSKNGPPIRPATPTCVAYRWSVWPFSSSPSLPWSRRPSVGAAGAFFGNGFVAFLAEDIVRHDPHTLFELMIIAHLHIMLTLIDVMILLLVIRTYRVEGRVHKIAVPLTIVGTIIVTFATWSVIGWEVAHKSHQHRLGLFAARRHPGGHLGLCASHSGGYRRRSGYLGSKLRALFRDPVRFGIFFELIFVNLVVSVPGVYVAFNLDTYRTASLPGCGAHDPRRPLARPGHLVGRNRPVSHCRPAGHARLGAPGCGLGSPGRLDPGLCVCQRLYVPGSGPDQSLAGTAV